MGGFCLVPMVHVVFTCVFRCVWPQGPDTDGERAVGRLSTQSVQYPPDYSLKHGLDPQRSTSLLSQG